MPNYEMFTNKGNQAVEEALTIIMRLSQDRTKVWNRDTLELIAAPALQAVAKIHGEIYDTEPRGYIADFLDSICRTNGWYYDEYGSYDF